MKIILKKIIKNEQKSIKSINVIKNQWNSMKINKIIKNLIWDKATFSGNVISK